ncbi:hypothetical protein ACV4QK_08830 [Alteromonas macleodii]
MEVEVIKSIETVLIEAIKIIGPAIIASFATYKATSSQYKFKVKELSKNHEFKAREHLFSYYKDRQQKLASGHSELSNSLGQILGAASSAGEESDTPEIVNGFISMLGLYVNQAPFEISTTISDFDSKRLSHSPEYAKLLEYKKSADNLIFNKEPKLAKIMIIELLEIYSFLERCNHMLLERQIKQLFSNYVDNA